MNTSFDVRLRGAVLASGVSREEAKKVCMAHQGSVIIPVAPKSNGAAKAQSPAPSAKRPKYYAVVSMNNNDDPGTIYVGWDNARPHIDGKPVWHKGFSTPTQANTFISERLAEREANRALAHKATEELSAIFRGAPALNHNSTFSEDMAEVYNGPAAPDVNLMGTFASIKMAQKAALQEDLLREDLRPAIDDDSPPWDVKPFSN